MVGYVLYAIFTFYYNFRFSNFNKIIKKFKNNWAKFRKRKKKIIYLIFVFNFYKYIYYFRKTKKKPKKSPTSRSFKSFQANTFSSKANSITRAIIFTIFRILAKFLNINRTTHTSNKPFKLNTFCALWAYLAFFSNNNCNFIIGNTFIFEAISFKRTIFFLLG